MFKPLGFIVLAAPACHRTPDLQLPCRLDYDAQASAAIIGTDHQVEAAAIFAVRYDQVVVFENLIDVPSGQPVAREFVLVFLVKLECLNRWR